MSAMSLIDIATIVRNGSHPSVEDGRTPWANEKSTGGVERLR